MDGFCEVPDPPESQLEYIPPLWNDLHKFTPFKNVNVLSFFSSASYPVW